MTSDPKREMSRQEFAGIAARIAGVASKWSGDCISDLRDGKIQAPMQREAALSFTKKIDEMLSWIRDECNG